VVSQWCQRIGNGVGGDDRNAVSTVESSVAMQEWHQGEVIPALTIKRFNPVSKPAKANVRFCSGSPQRRSTSK